MDNHSPSVRSYNMSHIKSTGSKPEELARKYLFAQKFRFRKNVRTLPGSPDIVLPKYKTVVFVNGCFWHMHEKCSDFVWPKSNQAYWFEKITRNKLRDEKNYHLLKEKGWKVLVIWECELKTKLRRAVLERLCNEIIK